MNYLSDMAPESQFALRLLDGIGVQRQNGTVLADKAYSSHALRNELKNRGIKTVIPLSTILFTWDKLRFKQ